MSEQNKTRKEQEMRTEQSFQNKFNSITEKTKPVNQNQEHNVKEEGIRKR